MESSLQRENSKALQCMEKTGLVEISLGISTSYYLQEILFTSDIVRTQQHSGESSQKIELILHSSADGELEITVPGNLSYANTCKTS